MSRIIIAGSREGFTLDLIALGMEMVPDAYRPSVVISGGARGVDSLGEEWANLHNIPIERYPADWKTYGKRAGPIRNEQMAEVADGLIAFWDEESRGTKHMISIAKKKNLYVHVFMLKSLLNHAKLSSILNE